MPLSVLVLHERWPGATGLSAVNALRRAGASVHSATEAETIPLNWQSTTLRVAGRALRALAVREFNAQLLGRARLLEADLLLVFKGPFVQAQTLRALRAEGMRCVNFYPDVSFSVHGPYLEDSLREYDWVFSTKSFGIADLRNRLGIRSASVLQHAFDPEIHRPTPPNAREERRFRCDVSFIGTWSPAKQRLLEAVDAGLPDCTIRVFGSQWERAGQSSRIARIWGGHPVSGTEYAVAIGCARVNLGLLSERRPGASDGDRITSRTFHIPAAGGCLLHQRTDELTQVLREGIDCEAFDGAEELIHKIELLLQNEPRRKDIAANGLARVRAAHSWDHRIRQMMERLQHEGVVETRTMDGWPPVSECQFESRRPA